jgi:hypothetical protein
VSGWNNEPILSSIPAVRCAGPLSFAPFSIIAPPYRLNKID